MGFIRLLLALSIVIYHTYPIAGYSLLENHLAVQSFFVISGFYMALILNEKYNKAHHSYRLFITNRILRIYPTYYVALAAMFLLSLFVIRDPTLNPLTPYLQFLSDLPLWSQIFHSIYFILHNLTLIFTLDFINPEPLPISLIVLLAWTLEVEMFFYLIAPFLVRRSTLFLIGIGLFSFISRLLFYNLDFLGVAQPDDRFIPNQLIFFAAGIISYRIYTVIKNKDITETVQWLMFITLIVFTLIYNYLPYQTIFVAFHPINWLYIMMITFAIPVIFLKFSKSRIDRIAGEISYPLYITHGVVVILFAYFFPQLRTSTWFFFAVIAAEIAIIYPILKFIEMPIDRYRQRRIVK